MAHPDDPDRRPPPDRDAGSWADPTRPLAGPGDDPTRRTDPADEAATRRVDPAAPPGSQDATQRIDPDEVTAAGAHRPPLEGSADPLPPPGEPTWDEATALDEEEAPPEKRRGRDLAFTGLGLLLGIILAFLVIAWGTSDRAAQDDAALAAEQERVAALEAENESLQVQITELEAQLSEAEAAAGDREEDIQAQRDALDERSAALEEYAATLDERAASLDQRSAQLDEREQQLDQREAELDQREAELDQAGETPAPPPQETENGQTEPGNGEGGIDLPEIDSEEVETFLDRVLDQLRSLFD